MTNPFENIEKAFEPFYSEDVVVKCKDGDQHSVKAFIMTDNTTDPDEDFLDTDVEVLNFIIDKCCKCDFLYKVQRGDTVMRYINNKQYAVANVVEDFALGIIIKAKQMKK